MIIDAHTHLPTENWTNFPAPMAKVDQAVNYLRQAGTDAAIFNTWQGVFAETADDLIQANAEALRLAKQYQGFLYPGACLHPAFPEASRDALAMFRDHGYRWVGELVPYRKPYRYVDSAFLKLCEICAAHGHVLQLHLHEDILTVARNFPSMPVICSHVLPSLCSQLAAEPNIWLDISGSEGGGHIGALEAACDTFGTDHMLYGTDFIIWEPGAFQARVNAVIKDPVQREAVLWKNAASLLEKSGVHLNIPPV